MPRRPRCNRRSTWTVTHADCLDVLPSLDADTVDAIITDPPYGINYNGMSGTARHASTRQQPAGNDDDARRPRARTAASSSSRASGAAPACIA